MELKMKSPHHIMMTDVHCGDFHHKIYYVVLLKIFLMFSLVVISADFRALILIRMRKHMDSGHTSKAYKNSDFRLNQLLRTTFVKCLRFLDVMWWCSKRKYAHSSECAPIFSLFSSLSMQTFIIQFFFVALFLYGYYFI